MNEMDALAKGKIIKVFSYYDGESDDETTYKKGRIAIVKRGINPPSCDDAIIKFVDNGELATLNYATDKYKEVVKWKKKSLTK